ILLEDNGFDKRKYYVDYVGPVNFKIDFTGDIINTSTYDKCHETTTNSKVKTAKECITELRQTILLEKQKEAEKEAKRQEDELKQKKLENTASQLISQLLGNNNFKLSNFYGSS